MSTVVARTGSKATHRAAEALLERLLSAYSAHDAEALGALYTEDAVVRLGELEVRGRQAVTALWAHWFEALPDVSTELERVVVEPSRLWLEWTERGTHGGRLCMDDLEIPARGRRLAWRGLSIYELSEREVARVDYYIDRLMLAEQLYRSAAVVLALSRRLGRAKAAIRERLRYLRRSYRSSEIVATGGTSMVRADAGSQGKPYLSRGALKRFVEGPRIGNSPLASANHPGDVGRVQSSSAEASRD